MATNTYVALDTKTVIGSPVTSIDFTSIPQGYTDLVLVVSAQSNSGYDSIRFNGDTGSNYSKTSLSGDGTSATSYSNTNETRIPMFGVATLPTSGSSFFISVTNIMNYSNTTSYKTILHRDASTASGTDFFVGLWRSNSAITSFTLYPHYNLPTSNTFSVGSTFSLYGIAKEGTSPAPKATGGAIYSDSTYYYHVFASTGTFTPLSSLTADVLVVAGGGGAGSGGGGAGGALTFASQSLSATGYTCTVGGGGAGGNFASSIRGTNGTNSQFGALTACVGGGGGGMRESQGGGASGGSGGGASASSVTSQSGGSFTSGQGYAGGNQNNTGSPYSGAGGGGAGGVGGSVSVAGVAGNGGIGLTSSLITTIVNATAIGQLVGSNGYIAGGGGGGNYGSGGTSSGSGGYGGGGVGSNYSVLGSNGLPSTGGGGGGASGIAPDGGFSGGSGVVVVRYTKV